MKFNIPEDPLGVLSSTKYVLENSKYVEINPKNIRAVSRDVKSRIEKGLDDAVGGFDISRGIKNNTQLIFVEDAVNFCFWAEKDREKWQVEWPEGNVVSGGWYALVKSFERSLNQSEKILDAGYLSEITLNEVRELFKSSNGIEIPLIAKRFENLIEVGKVLSDKYDGEFINLIEQSGFDAIKIVKNIYGNFSSFKDIAETGGRLVYFLKRAQIIANDLTYIFGEKILNTNLLTAFADYKLPQIFREFEMINYSQALAKKVDNYVLISKGSREEIEIRSAAIWCVELLKQELNGFSSSQIDNAIWLLSQDQTKISKPYHRTYTIYY
jgi:hypothetical protein